MNGRAPGRRLRGGPGLDAGIGQGWTEGTPAGKLRVRWVTGRPRPADVRTALILSRGLMGSNSALVLTASA